MMDGDSTIKASLRAKIEEELQAQLRQIDLQNARETGNQELIVAQQYMDLKAEMEEQARQQQLAAEEEYRQAQMAAYQRMLDEQARLDAEAAAKRQGQIELYKEYITGPLSQGVSDLITAAMEGTDNIGQSAFDMLYGIAKNIFSSSLSNLINAGLLAIANQFEANSKLGLPGLAIATAASGVITGIMAGLKAKMSPPERAHMAVGGYISDGMVRGAGGSGDSVPAMLQPGERVLSKRETEAYDKQQSQQPINQIININISGQLSSPGQITQCIRQTVIPELRRAKAAGYAY